jgi:amino acid adenylation domain-containing protein
LPNKLALVCGDRRLTYAELEAMANRLANALVAGGVERGDRVAIHLDNSVEAVVAVFATLKADGVFVPVNPTTKHDKLAYIVNNCAAKALIGGGKTDLGTAEVPSLRCRVFCGQGKMEVESQRSVPPPHVGGYGTQGSLLSFERIQQEFPATRPATHNIDLDLACLIYTSGSTGEPKGVMSDHSNVVFASGSIIEYLENRESDIVINVLPLSFDYGLYQLLMTFRFGGTLVLEKSFAYPAEILKVMQRERVTGFPGVPTVYAMLLGMDLSAYDLSSLRYLTNTAAALPVAHILAIRDKFPQARLYSMYGLTETKRTLYLPPGELDRRPGSVGIAIPGTEAWLENDQGERLGPDQLGELVVRGRHVMRGYWNAPEATARRYRPGRIPGERYCYTGDLFRQDAEGFFYFVGRKDDIIKSRGEKVAPKEVENVLYALDGVAEAAVIGVPDPVLGQAVKAFVVARDCGLTAQAILAHCKRNLEDFAVPKYVEFRDQLPKTSSGKISGAALK